MKIIARIYKDYIWLYRKDYRRNTLETIARCYGKPTRILSVKLATNYFQPNEDGTVPQMWCIRIMGDDKHIAEMFADYIEKG